MNMIAAQEIKRCGISAVDKALAFGPVQVIKNNQPKYVILTEKDYETILHDMAEARLASSEADLKAGRFKKGKAKDLMNEIKKHK